MKLGVLFNKVRVWGFAGIASYIERRLNMARQSRRLAALERRSTRRAMPEKGITVVGELLGQASTCKTLRDFVLSLRDAGIPFQTLDTSPAKAIPDADRDGIITPECEFDFHRFSHFFIMFRSPLTPNLTAGHTVCRIVFFEGDHGINITDPYLRESKDDIVAMSDFNYRYFLRAFPEQRVWKITYPLRPSRAAATPRQELRRKFDIPDDAFAVFFNFDFGSYYRKDIPSAMRAYALAFAGDKSARLVFKTKGARKNPQEVREMLALADSLGITHEFIHISDYLARADLDGLTRACDVYMSLHHSEGFGLGMAEAMLDAKCVVATDWSANTEFCTPATSWPVPYTKVAIKPHEYPTALREWAQADAEAAASALKEIRQNPESAQQRGTAAQKLMAEHFSIEHFTNGVNAVLERKQPA